MISTICYININLVVTHVVLGYTQLPVAAHSDMTIIYMYKEYMYYSESAELDIPRNP